ncbi:MAG: hypothetical protein KatS3mg109_2071 [Pirellulaceae bacterium]|nr:MAG: hypothetical protein KatS3mg109_2071 [Pirellulaceae bacterium]
MNLGGLHSLPDAGVCAVCGASLDWVVGGRRCPREEDDDHDGHCIICGEDDDRCLCWRNDV